MRLCGATEELCKWFTSQAVMTTPNHLPRTADAAPGCSLIAGGWWVASGGGFWIAFEDNKGRVHDPKVWEWIVRKGGDEGTPESLRKRIRMLKKADVHDPRDGMGW